MTYIFTTKENCEDEIILEQCFSKWAIYGSYMELMEVTSSSNFRIDADLLRYGLKKKSFKNCIRGWCDTLEHQNECQIKTAWKILY